MIFEHIGEGLDELVLSKEQEIELNKDMSRRMSEVRAKAKGKECFYCGKAVTSFCSSHNVPRFCLENIGINGKVAGLNAILKLPEMGNTIGKNDLGIGNAGVFKLLCRECDSTIFQDYENPDNYYEDQPPTQKMLAQIALKNYLKFISKRKMEIALTESLLEEMDSKSVVNPFLYQELNSRLKTSKIDLEAYIKEYKQAKKFANKEGTNNYYIIYYRLLDYVVPVAVQAPIAVSIDLEGGVINDVVNMDPKYEISDLHLCVFPLKSHTAIIMFIENGKTRYRKFYKQFRKKTEEEKLGIINYLIFLYCEDYFLARDIQSMVDLDEFKTLASLTPVSWDVCPIEHTESYADEFTLAKWNTVPNLLLKKYKVR